MSTVTNHTLSFASSSAVSQNTDKFDQFPNETMVNIFKSMSLPEIMKMRKVSQRFRKIVDSNITSFETQQNRDLVASKYYQYSQSLQRSLMVGVLKKQLNAASMFLPLSNEKFGEISEEIYNEIIQDAMPIALKTLANGELSLSELLTMNAYIRSPIGSKASTLMQSISQEAMALGSAATNRVLTRHMMSQ